jgi:4-hydroxy-2-oxoheptanedioate aldolase
MKSLLDLPRRGEMSLGVYISDCGVTVAEIACMAGFDYMRIDDEHTLNDGSTLQNLIRVATAHDVPTLVRISCPDDVTKLLDFGASGIMFPGVETVEQAETAVRLCKYAPLGERGVYRAGRMLDFGLAPYEEYFKNANDRVSVCVQIESGQGLERLDEILSVPGVDLVTIGPWDMAQSLGYMGKPDHPEVKAAQELVIQKAKEHGVFCLFGAGGPEQVASLKEKGVYLATICTDVPFVARSMKAHVGKCRV